MRIAPSDSTAKSGVGQVAAYAVSGANPLADRAVPSSDVIDRPASVRTFPDDDIVLECVTLPMPVRMVSDDGITPDSSESALSVRRLRRTKRDRCFVCFLSLSFICIPGSCLQYDRGLIQVAIDGNDELAIH